MFPHWALCLFDGQEGQSLAQEAWWLGRRGCGQRETGVTGTVEGVRALWKGHREGQRCCRLVCVVCVI